MQFNTCTTPTDSWQEIHINVKQKAASMKQLLVQLIPRMMVQCTVMDNCNALQAPLALRQFSLPQLSSLTQLLTWISNISNSSIATCGFVWGLMYHVRGWHDIHYWIVWANGQLDIRPVFNNVNNAVNMSQLYEENVMWQMMLTQYTKATINVLWC